MSILEDFKAKFPEFDETIVDEQLPALIDMYQCIYCAEYGVNDCDDQAILYLLAHLLSLQTTGNSGNFASSKSDGDVSISYALPTTYTGNQLYYMSSKYGVTFWQLTNKNAQGGFFV